MIGIMGEVTQDDFLEFINGFKSLTLSTIDENNLPYTSFAPFIKYKHKYYIYISALAKHFQNLNKNNNCSVFFIEDENICTSIFQRKRVVLQAKTKKVLKDTNEHCALVQLFYEKHGDIIRTLKTLQDFYIHEITPKKGHAVFGFGREYHIEGEYCNELIIQTSH